MNELIEYMNKHLDCTDIKYGFQVGHYDLETAFSAIMDRIDHFNDSDDVKHDTVMMFLHE